MKDQVEATRVLRAKHDPPPACLAECDPAGVAEIHRKL
jgi:hypothetical protein